MATRREDLGSWLEGTPGEDAPDGVSGLGLPLSGPGSLAGVPRRLAALAVDWVLSLAVSAALFPGDRAAALPLLTGHPTATLAVFAVSTVVLVATLGHTVGHRLLGLHVLRLSVPDASGGTGTGPSAPGVRAALTRTGLLCLVIPAVVWDRTGRGMHDVAAGTALVRR